MNRSGLAKFYRLLAVALRCAPVLPVLSFADTLIFGRYNGVMLLENCAVVIIPALLGCILFGLVLDCEEAGGRRAFLRTAKVLIHIMGILLCAGGAWLFRGEIWYGAIPAFVLSYAMFLFCARFARADYGDIFRIQIVYGTIASYAITAFILFIASLNWEIAYNSAPNTASLLVILALSALLLNQSHIDMLMQRNRGVYIGLPMGARRNNLLLVAAVCGLFLLLFLLRDYIAAGLGWLGQAALAGIRALFRLLPGGEGEFTEERLGQQLASHDMLEGLAGEKKSGISWIFAVFAVVMGGFAVWRFAPMLWRALLDKIAQFFNWLARVFGGYRKREGRGQDTLFTDSEESLEANRSAQPANESGMRGRSRIRKLKREYRAYKNDPDPGLRVRAGYRLMIGLLDLRGEQVRQSDTTAQTAENVRSPELREPLEGSAEIYDAVRYGMQDPTGEQLERFDGQVDRVAGKLLR